MRKIAIIFPLLAFYYSVSANITLPAVLGSNMVLQQRSTAKIWGWGNPLEKVLVTTSWDNKTDSVIVNPQANWQVTVSTPAAGGPYTITIKGGNTIVLDNVMVGEVWVCSGQSNMEMSYSWGLPDVAADLPTAYNKNIRFFTVAKASSAYPQIDCKGQWVVCDSNTLKTFSAVAYFFGKNLNMELNVPIGLINTSWGGTPAEVWTPDNAIAVNQVLSAAAAKQKVVPYCPVKPGCVYNTMIAPLLNYNVAGAIWYQGESNTATAATYAQLLDTMIACWRTAWHKDLPFYFVQIAPFTYGPNLNAAVLREQQAKVMKFPNTGMVVTNDLVTDTTDIHPKNKHDVGYRLANWALTEVYGYTGMLLQGPRYKGMTVDKGKVTITFNSTVTAKNKNIGSVYIAGNDKIFYPAEVTVQGDKIEAWSSQVKQPVALRYAFTNTALATLFGFKGLPVVPFRTDDWEINQ